MEKKICKRCGQVKQMASWETKCYACQKAEMLEKIQAEIKAAKQNEDIDTWSDDYVICPYCGYAIETDVGYEDFPEIYEEGEHYIECPECEKTFTLYTNISYDWETKKEVVKNVQAAVDKR